MTENINDNPKRVVPTITLEEYKKGIQEGKPLPPGNYKIRQEDSEEFIRLITKNEIESEAQEKNEAFNEFLKLNKAKIDAITPKNPTISIDDEWNDEKYD